MDKEQDIIVEAIPTYIESQSSPDENRYVFAYTITITNAGDQSARLIRRHWLITDSNGRVQEVEGEGVIGKKPYLKPGQSFRYTSGAMIETAVGIMQGRYTMVDDDGESFNVPIPKFTLSIPRTLH